MKLNSIRLLLLATLCVVFTYSSNAFAQEKTFGELVGEAKTAYDAGDFEKAIDALLAANRVEPNARLLLNVARSYNKASDCANSLAYYGAFTRHPDAESDLVDTAKSEADAIECDTFDENASGRITFVSDPAGADVKMDGVKIGTTPFEAVQLGAGVHTFEFSKEGMKTEEKKLQLARQTDLNVEQRLVEAKEEVVVAPPKEEPKVEEPQEKDMTQYYIAGGIAAAGLGFVTMGLVYDLVIIPGTDEDRKAFQPGTPEYNDLTDTRSSQATTAIIGYTVGGVLLASGAGWLTYLFLTDTSDETKDTTIEDRIGFAPIIGADTAGLTMFGRF